MILDDPDIIMDGSHCAIDQSQIVSHQHPNQLHHRAIDTVTSLCPNVCSQLSDVTPTRSETTSSEDIIKTILPSPKDNGKLLQYPHWKGISHSYAILQTNVW